MGFKPALSQTNLCLQAQHTSSIFRVPGKFNRWHHPSQQGRKPSKSPVEIQWNLFFQKYWLSIILARAHTEFAVCQLTWYWLNLQAFLALCDAMTSQGYLHNSQQHLSADLPPQATVLSTRVLNAVNHHSCTKPVRTESLVPFSSPPHPSNDVI